MKREILTQGDYTLLKVTDGFIVINNKGGYNNHTHVHNIDRGTDLVNQAYNQIIPIDKRVIYSLLRIVQDDKFRWELSQALRVLKQNKRRT